MFYYPTSNGARVGDNVYNLCEVARQSVRFQLREGWPFAGQLCIHFSGPKSCLL